MAKKYKVIVNVKGHVYESGATSPNYVTVCKKPHWDSEGIMLQGNLGDATKFEVYDSDAEVIFEYTKKRYEGKREFALVEVDERILSTPLRELWGTGDTKGDFDETGLINGNFVREVHKKGELPLVKGKCHRAEKFLETLAFCRDVEFISVREDFEECFNYVLENSDYIRNSEKMALRKYFIEGKSWFYIGKGLDKSASAVKQRLDGYIYRVSDACGNLFEVGLQEYKKNNEGLKMNVGYLNIPWALQRKLYNYSYLDIDSVLKENISILHKILTTRQFALLSIALEEKGFSLE